MLQEAELSAEADSENNLGGSSETMYYIGLDVHKKTISYCVKDAAGLCAWRGQDQHDETGSGCLGQGVTRAKDDRDGSDDLHRLDL